MSTQQPQLDTIHSRIRKARQAIGAIAKTRKGGGGSKSYPYADLGSVLAEVQPALDANGLAHSQSFELRESAGAVVVSCITTLFDDAGSTVESAMVMPVPNTADPQTWGAVTTYARRYGLLAALGLQAEDTDAIARRAPEPEAESTPKVAQPSPDDTIAPRKAALDAVAARIGGAKELKRRLDVIAATEPDAGGFDGQAQTREKLADRMNGDAKGWRGLPDAAFDALVVALTEWPEGL